MNEAIMNKKSLITPAALDLLCQGICYNTTAYPTKNQAGKLQQSGNKTECALLELADRFNYSFESFRPTDRIFRSIPFNSKRKKMITVVFN